MKILILGIVAVVLVWIVKYAIDHNIFHISKLDNKNRAFAALKKRYARGEINKQEYEAEKNILFQEIK